MTKPTIDSVREAAADLVLRMGSHSGATAMSLIRDLCDALLAERDRPAEPGEPADRTSEPPFWTVRAKTGPAAVASLQSALDTVKVDRDGWKARAEKAEIWRAEHEATRDATLDMMGKAAVEIAELRATVERLTKDRDEAREKGFREAVVEIHRLLRQSEAEARKLSATLHARNDLRTAADQWERAQVLGETAVRICGIGRSGAES